MKDRRERPRHRWAGLPQAAEAAAADRVRQPQQHVPVVEASGVCTVWHLDDPSSSVYHCTSEQYAILPNVDSSGGDGSDP